jgi:microcystin-dependent protein
MDPFLAEIRIMGFNFPPRGWAQCGGQLMSISQNTALFSLLGTNFGGDGRVTFGLPNLQQGRTVVGAGAGPGLTPRSVGEVGGEPAVTLLAAELPSHGHTLNGTNSPADVSSPTGTTALARSTGKMVYTPVPAQPQFVTMNPSACGQAPGGGQPHNNLMPYQVLNYCIAIQGIFPQRP